MGTLNHRQLPAVMFASLALSACSVIHDPGREPVSDAASYAAYVMAYFTESPAGNGSNYGLHLAVSTDALNWMPLNQNEPVVTPAAGTLGLRDPFVARKQDGGFVILATDLNGTDFTQQNAFIHVWDSADLRTFTGYRRIQMHSLPTHSWAPEAFWDASRGQYAIIYSANDGTRDVIMVNYTADFITVGSPQVYFDPGFNVIDGDLLVGGGTGGAENYLYYKIADTGALQGARSSSLAPRSFDAGIYTSAISHGGTEAPIVVRSLTAEVWYLWGDTYTPNGVSYAWQSANIAADTWVAIDQKLYTPPLNCKHATIQPITSAELANLTAQWTQPSWNRLKPYDFPDHYLRHQDFMARIDTYPFDPYPDQQWRVVPGLADPAGVSFQAVNFPGYYLRQSNFALVLGVNDSSAGFHADATFYRVPGLADLTWSSFRSYGFPDRYLRHFDFQIRIDPISGTSSTLDLQDATFQLGY